MEVGFKYNEPGRPEKVYFEQIFAEKPGGGMVQNPSFDAPASTAVGFDEGKLKLIKAYRVAERAEGSSGSIKIEKGSGIVAKEFIGKGKLAAQVSAVNHENPAYDVLTVTFTAAVDKGEVLYQAKGASSDAAVPVLTPAYVIGNDVKANEGDAAVRLVNGANLRKETANIASEVAALLPTIQLV